MKAPANSYICKGCGRIESYNDRALYKGKKYVDVLNIEVYCITCSINFSQADKLPDGVVYEDNFGAPSMATEFNIEILRANTPLRSEKEVLEVLMLVNPVDTEKMYKILDGIVPFEPEDTYFTRLYKSLAMAKI